MKRLFFTGFILNMLVSGVLWVLNPGLAQGYGIGAFAMLANLLFLAASRLLGGVGFLGLVALTYWVVQWLPGVPLYLYAVGLASPVWVALVSLRAVWPLTPRA